MKQLLPLLLFLPIPVIAGPSQFHDQCLKAADYMGCIKVMTGNSGGTTTIKIDQTNRPGLLAEMGNECPVGTAYVGGGKCRAIVCVYKGIFGRNRPDLAGKGHSCEKGWGDFLGHRGSLEWGNSYTNASNNPNCPAVEPGYGYRSSCQGKHRNYGQGTSVTPQPEAKPEPPKNCWTTYLDNNPNMKVWAEANPGAAAQNKKRFDDC